MIKYAYLLPASMILFWLFSSPPHTTSQGVTQDNSNIEGYSCTVRFTPADPSTDRMAMWEVVVNIGRRSSSKSVIWAGWAASIKQDRDKRVADAACRDFFAERARHQSPGEDTQLGK